MDSKSTALEASLPSQLPPQPLQSHPQSSPRRVKGILSGHRFDSPAAQIDCKWPVDARASLVLRRSHGFHARSRASPSVGATSTPLAMAGLVSRAQHPGLSVIHHVDRVGAALPSVGLALARTARRAFDHGHWLSAALTAGLTGASTDLTGHNRFDW